MELSRAPTISGLQPLVADGFRPQNLESAEDTPPAYGKHLDHLELSQPGFEAGAAVTNDGRVNININQKNSRLATLLAPTLHSQLQETETSSPSSPPPPAYIPPTLGGAPGQTPPPRLNVVVQIVGSRGDVQPFVALGKVLRNTYGHRVRIATHATFRKFVEDNGLEFFSIGGDPAELMAFMVKNPGLMPGLDALKSGEIGRRRQGVEEILLGCWRSCIEAGDGLGPPPPTHRVYAPIDESYVLPGDPADKPFVADAIIANPPSFAHIHVAEKLGIPLHMMFTMPWSPTRAFPHPLANIESSNTDVVMTNYVSYAMVEMMTWQGLGDIINRFRANILDLEPLSLIWAPGLLTRLRIPTTYCWSPALIPKPADWAKEISISGFFFLNLASSYTPEPDLAAFLAAGPPPVYIGFGSIVVDDPNSLTRLIFDAVSISGVRALVSKGWGGLGTDSVGIPDGVFMLGNCPHDWLFQHVSAVVHHGGAGTCAAGINAGRPTVVVPFFGDQPFWGSMVARAGAGPAPIPYKKLTAENLAAAITDALKPETQARAQELGAKIREEKGVDVGGKSFHDFLDTDKMRCSLAPNRVAVWRVRRTQTRLSTLAAAILVKEGLIDYPDLKLYRPVEYVTDDQPWDPISAVTAVLLGEIGSITMAVADFPREIFTRKRNGSNVGSPSELKTGSATSINENASTISRRLESTNASSASLPSIAVTGPSLPPQSSLETLPEHTLSPQQSRVSSQSPSLRPSSSSYRDLRSDEGPATIETVMGASRAMNRLITTSVKSPMNFCLGLARGFRNAPRLYHDDMVRPTEKVTDLTSGLKVAGKEFGLGLYDGLSGLILQPLRGAEKEGGVGLLKGFGKGAGGLFLKPVAGVWALPAYTMQGIHAEVRSRTKWSSLNYVITSRVLQGREDLESSSAEEQSDVLQKWQALTTELAKFYLLKQRERPHEVTRSTAGNISTEDLSDAGSGGPQTGWRYAYKSSFDERRKMNAQKDAWKKQRRGVKAGRPGTATSVGGSSLGSGSSSTLDDDEFERAIVASVEQSSRGDREEDARIERAIRESVREMRRIAQEQELYRKEYELQQAQRQAREQEHERELQLELGLDGSTPVFELEGSEVVIRSEIQELPAAVPHQPAALLSSNFGGGGGGEEEDDDENLVNITDEEYQALIEEAVRRSIMQQATEYQMRQARDEDDEDDDYGFLQQDFEPSPIDGSGERARERRGGDEDDEEMRRAIEESMAAQAQEQQQGPDHEEIQRAIEASMAEAQEEQIPDHEREREHEAELQRALEESERAHREQTERDQQEEEIVLEFIKKQSLAEEEYRQSRAKGKGVVGRESLEEEEDEVDDDLRKALEESLKIAGQGQGDSGATAGPSSS